MHIPEIPIVKEEPTTSKKADVKPKTPFSVMKPAAVKKPEIKNEVDKPKVKSPENKVEISVKVEEPAKDVKLEKSSPEEPKATSKASSGKNHKVQLKNQKPVQKGSISSFFNNKPGTSKAPVAAPKVQAKSEEVKDKTESKANESNAKKRALTPEPVAQEDSKKKQTSNKRTLTPEPVPVAQEETKKKKPAAKKIKLKEPANNKRSRIRVMQDSSDEEEEAKSEPEEPETKFIKFDREFTPERESSPEVVEVTPEKKPEVAKSKRKAKRWVTKRFQTDDGFMRTERVQEEYSASEGENDENKKKNSPAKPKADAVKKTPEKKKKPENGAQAVGKKQGNIMSFFTKK